ncbi:MULTISPECIES: alpha-amylase family glycosyl hydrolase [unclassified Lentimicrobium]|uniref:alpha-amylase family glycosyl hydrolase n=1 Tax=unclassified Lentimicrobium TaxID=2677434 RepID=UPI0015553B2D|nr:MULTISPECIES: alpha-amylase family glycosyl hydrolase [unclassified Lentimicrobium]NPD46780.1 alpha-amylase [Lentimicrobium sp. S6]NPD85683.1 alpha-amylase [Lentimicrobium sp. L6]
MNKAQNFEILKNSFKELYPNEPLSKLESFISELTDLKKEIPTNENPDWYKDAVVYSLYVDLFNKDFNGLIDKLDHIASLGVTCLWLLPILDSPMKDAGFDIKDYRRIRPELFNMPDTASSEDQQVKFREFLEHAHSKGIKVIFDIAMNHCSMEHPWFQEARKGKDNPYRDYFIWNKDTEKYKEARLLFKGMCPSNWEKDGEEYFFHRFFEFQPDWNYRNPAVLLDMSRNIAFWMQQGVDGFRADAIPYLWKEEGTDCENLPKTHTILRFFRAVSEYLSPGTLLLAEACQKPQDVVDYIKTGNECNAAYHFPLMPQMFKALSMESAEPVLKTLSPEVTPEIPANSQWFTFLRCHDELSLELVYVDEADRAYIHKNYCHQPEWDFRVGEGISSRMSELFKKDVQKIKLAYSLMLSLPGTPVLYYGDEFGKGNDEEFYKEMIQMTGKDDTRFLVRGKVNWEEVEAQLDKRDSFESQIFAGLSAMVNARNKYKAFGRGEIEWLENNELGLLSFKRKFENEEILVLINLSGTDISYDYDGRFPFQDILGQNIRTLKNKVMIPAYSYYWIALK